jgi:hypothetical protein
MGRTELKCSALNCRSVIVHLLSSTEENISRGHVVECLVVALVVVVVDELGNGLFQVPGLERTLATAGPWNVQKGGETEAWHNNLTSLYARSPLGSSLCPDDLL